jgi:hypothetical protein
MKWETKYQLEIEVEDGFDRSVPELLADFKSDAILGKVPNYAEQKITLANLVIVRNSLTIVSQSSSLIPKKMEIPMY